MISLGDTDFNMISGGNVYVPVGAATDSLVTKDGAVENGQYTRQYFFGEAPVGTAVMAAVQEQDTTLIDESQKNLKAAGFLQNIQKSLIILLPAADSW